MGQTKFEIRKGTNEAFYFELKGENNELILTSHGYASKAICRRGMESVFQISTDESHFEKKADQEGHNYFILKSDGGEIIGNSQMYTTSSARDLGIHHVHGQAEHAYVIDLTI